MTTIYLNEKEIEKYIITLEICKNNLPGYAHHLIMID